MLLFLMASGLTLIFSMMGVLNFAHARFFFGFQISRIVGFWPAFVVAPVLVGGIGALVERYGDPWCFPKTAGGLFRARANPSFSKQVTRREHDRGSDEDYRSPPHTNQHCLDCCRRGLPQRWQQ